MQASTKTERDRVIRKMAQISQIGKVPFVGVKFWKQNSMLVGGIGGWIYGSPWPKQATEKQRLSKTMGESRIRYI